MASNQVRFVKNLYGPHITGPLVGKGKFAAGASVPIKMGELLELTGNTNTEWVPMDSDFAMSANVAIAACQLKSGDLAGYYDIIIPRPGDVFEFALDASDDLAPGTALYWSNSETVTDTAGTNILGHTVDFDVLPAQGFASDDASPDAGTTVKFKTRVRMTIRAATSYYAAIQK